MGDLRNKLPAKQSKSARGLEKLERGLSKRSAHCTPQNRIKAVPGRLQTHEEIVLRIGQPEFVAGSLFNPVTVGGMKLHRDCTEAD